MIVTATFVTLAGKSQLHLRLRPAQKWPASLINWAAEFELGAVAQLEERRAGSAKVRGSSPLSSTSSPTEIGAYEFAGEIQLIRRTSAGETFLITRRGKPYARLCPPHEQLIEPPRPPRLEVVE